MRELFQRFNELTILVIGDVMLDSYYWGNADRISPEAPVPVVSAIRKESRLGGASNVALNLKALGANVIICTAIGDDPEAADFLAILTENKLVHSGIIKVKDRPTTTKIRVMAHKHQVVRIDFETDKTLDAASTTLLIQKIRGVISAQKIHAIVFEDYDKGVISPSLITEIVEFANEQNIITVVDPKKRNFLDYKNVTLFKPNLKELREGLKMEIDPNHPNELHEATDHLQGILSAKYVMVTLSELGVYMNSATGKKIIPAHIRNISDVSGAGDTVISTVACCLAAGLDEFKTAEIANLAGGLVCEESGVVPIDKEKLLQEVLLVVSN